MINLTKKVLFQALDQVPAPTVILDDRKPGLPVVYVNHAVESLIGRDGSDLIGVPFAQILAEGSLPEVPVTQDAVQDREEMISDRQKWNTRDGVSVLLDVRMVHLLNRPEQPGFWMLSVTGDAELQNGFQAQKAAELRNELVDAHRQIRNLQRTDPVTGLANEAAFAEVLERDWSIARREQRRIGVIVFQIDCLDEYRQIFGRHATDSLLRKVGHAIGGTLRRAGDLGARIAHNRFAVLIGDPGEEKSSACAKRIAAKVRDLAIHHPRSTRARFATVSYGVASEIPAWTKESVTVLEEASHQLDKRGQVVEVHDATGEDGAVKTGEEEAVS